MPIVFEEVQAEISAERGAEPERADEAQRADDSAELLRKLVQDLDILDERRARLVAN